MLDKYFKSIPAFSLSVLKYVTLALALAAFPLEDAHFQNCYHYENFTMCTELRCESKNAKKLITLFWEHLLLLLLRADAFRPMQTGKQKTVS